MGLQGVLNGLGGSLLASTANGDAMDRSRLAIKQHINQAWASEAVKQGVGYAKAGAPAAPSAACCVGL